MLRNRLLALVSLIIAVGCDKSATAPTRTDRPAITNPAPATPQEWRGVVEAFKDGPTLLLADGSEYRLGGTQSAFLTQLDGADVVIQGTNDLEGGIMIQSFLVVAVGGTEVADGVLEVSESGYALRLTADGSMREIGAASDELAQHVGDRLWVREADDGKTIFGVISGKE